MTEAGVHSISAAGEMAQHPWRSILKVIVGDSKKLFDNEKKYALMEMTSTVERLKDLMEILTQAAKQMEEIDTSGRRLFQ